MASLHERTTRVLPHRMTDRVVLEGGGAMSDPEVRETEIRVLGRWGDV
jgi:hypothetical protein